jgi:hypothetical protein
MLLRSLQVADVKIRLRTATEDATPTNKLSKKSNHIKMKKSILIFTGVIGLVALSLSFIDRSQFMLDDRSYFLESGDSVICKLDIAPPRFRKDGIPIKRIEVSNDSIYLEGDVTYNKYGESQIGKRKFISTFDSKGVVNTKELICFINKEKSIFSDSQDTIPNITKITIK